MPMALSKLPKAFKLPPEKKYRLLSSPVEHFGQSNILKKRSTAPTLVLKHRLSKMAKWQNFVRRKKEREIIRVNESKIFKIMGEKRKIDS